MNGLAGAAERRILEIVGSRVRAGRASITLPDGTHRAFEGRHAGPAAHVTLHRWRPLRLVTTTGAIGLADAYVRGDYDVDDLEAFLELCALHLEPAFHEPVPEWLHRLGRTAWRLLGNPSRPRGPLTDIVQHYDLGNEFYAEWLDETMTYSSAVFASGDMTLAQAQHEKYRRLAARTGVEPGDRVLEIGSGWGGFAVYLAGELGCHVTTVTISKEQHDYVEKLVVEHGLVDSVDARLQDFRTVGGSYDRIVSVEMMESVPQRLWDPFFRQLRDRLRPGGSVGLQLIVVAEHHWHESDEHPDFVRRYIFPGGQVPAPSVLHELAARHDLSWREDDGFGVSYARTLARWLEAFDEAWPRIREMGFDDRFRRMWRYYLAYCGAGFASGRTDVRQIVLDRA
ncbi:MAG: cyclopropane-fatty-acyl-phospholipid synthase family protein [Actinomycetota bacterium]